jgi:hypothetical protein
MKYLNVMVTDEKGEAVEGDVKIDRGICCM